MHLRYFGTTGMSTPGDRAHDDELGRKDTSWINLLRETGKTADVFGLNGEQTLRRR